MHIDGSDGLRNCSASGGKVLADTGRGRPVSSLCIQGRYIELGALRRQPNSQCLGGGLRVDWKASDTVTLTAIKICSASHNRPPWDKDADFGDTQSQAPPREGQYLLSGSQIKFEFSSYSR